NRSPVRDIDHGKKVYFQNGTTLCLDAVDGKSCPFQELPWHQWKWISSSSSSSSSTDRTSLRSKLENQQAQFDVAARDVEEKEWLARFDPWTRKKWLEEYNDLLHLGWNLWNKTQECAALNIPSVPLRPDPKDLFICVLH